MKKKDLIDIKNKSQKDLISRAKELQKSIIDSALEAKLGKTKNVHETRNKRKEMAQILTFLELKNIDAQNSLIDKKVENITTRPTKIKKEGKNVTK